MAGKRRYSRHQRQPQKASHRRKIILTPPPRVLLSPTAFKGTLTPGRAAAVMAKAVRKMRPSWRVRTLALADGGDGTLEVLSQALSAKKMSTRVRGPLGKPVKASWAVAGKTAVIEMARASGLTLTHGRNKIMEATSFGTGQLIGAAMDHGCRTILIGVGGTATAEGGAGALRALGLRYFDKQGRELSGRPVDLLKIARLDWENFDPRLRRTRIVVLCDVTNPLLGPNGSARVFAPQKGAAPSQVRLIERGLRRWSLFARRQTRNKPGSGAAGALAYGLSAFAGARLEKGARFILKATGWRKMARSANWILTGEGQIDHTSFSGKIIGEMIKSRPPAKIAAVCGRCRLSTSEWRRRGLAAVIEMGPGGLIHPETALRKAAERFLAAR